MKDKLGNISNVQCDLGGRNRRCFRRAGRKFLELDGFLPQQCTPHFSLPAVEAGKRYAILCTPTFYTLPTLFRCSDRLIPLLFPYCQCLLLHGVLLAASLYFLDCSQKYIFSMVLFSHFGENGERHGFIRRVRRYGLCPVHDGVQPQLRRFVRRRRWRWKPQQWQRWWRWQRVRLPDRYCSGRGADHDRLGWLNQSLQVKHKFSLWGFFESACRKRWSMIEWG